MSRAAGRRAIPCGTIECLTDGAAYMLSNEYAIDGGVSTHPPGGRGTASMNCYLLSCADRAVLIDSGLTIHAGALLRQLDELLDRGTTLDVMPLRFGEFNAVCNIATIAERFTVSRIYGLLLGSPEEWLDFQGTTTPARQQALRSAKGMPLPPDAIIDIASDRKLRTLLAPLRLLPLPWAFDADTGMMYTSDIFTWVPRTKSGRTVVDCQADDPTTEDDVYNFLVENRYWWLPGARTDPIRAALDALYAKYEIKILAPGYGSALVGRERISKHFDLLDRALARAGKERSSGVDPISQRGRTR